jgi:hypothetical protein
MSNDLSILVNSCDSYDDLWEPYFSLFHVQWADCPYPVYLNTETKRYNRSDMKIETINFNKSGGVECKIVSCTPAN